MLRLTDIDKTYGATHALKSFSVDVAPGTVLGLVGENGAGKSTLIKIASGAIAPDSGQITLDDKPVNARNTHEALAHGIASVYQELTVVRELTVEQNLLLTSAPVTAWGSIDRRRTRSAAAEILARHGLDIPPQARVADLPLGQQQMLEIVRAVERQPRVLLLDEATSALGGTEVEWLAALVQTLKADGRIVLFISHRWDEIVHFCNRVAVLRNGELMAVSDTAALPEKEAVRLMTGRATVEEGFPAKQIVARKATALTLRNARSSALDGVSLDLSRGEILGQLRKLFGIIEPAAEGAIIRQSIARAQVVTPDAAEPVRNLSGGNQQKVLLEKWLLTKPRILLLNDVTRGVDVATKRQIYETIARIASEGVGIIWYSTDARELVGVAHRVIVMLHGRISAELTGNDVTADRIIHAAVMGTDAAGGLQ